MNVWYAFLNALGIRMFEMDFMTICRALRSMRMPW